MPSTFVHALLPPAALQPLRKHFSLNSKEWIKLLIAAAILGNAPDLDIIPASFAGDAWKSIHRNWGHNLISLSFLAVIGQYAIRRWVSPSLSRRQSSWLAIGFVGSHVFFDSMQDVNEQGMLTGVPLLWPFSSWHFLLPFRLFKVLHLKPNIHFLWAHVTSGEFWHSGIFYEIGNSAIIWGIWFLVIQLVRFSTRMLFLFFGKNRKNEVEVPDRSETEVSERNASGF